MDIQVRRLNYPEYLLPLLRREDKILSLTFYQLPELLQLKSDPNLDRKNKLEILENIFSEFKSRGLNISLQEFVTANMLDDWMVDEELSHSQKQNLINSWITKCLNSRVASLDQLITTLIHNTAIINAMPTQSTGCYVFNSTTELRNRELWSQKYRPSINPEKEMINEEEEKEDESMSDIQIEILKNEEEEEEEEDEIRKDVKILGNKRKRQYKKAWFQTTVIPNDPRIRKKISNTKENNYWNAIAETIQPRWSHSILWRKDVTNILQDFKLTSPKIDGIIAVNIDDVIARHYLKNYVLHVGRYRDILLHEKSQLPYDELINVEKVTTNIMILDKKWKILKIINNTPSYELEWIQQKYEKRPQLTMKFTPIQWD